MAAQVTPSPPQVPQVVVVVLVLVVVVEVVVVIVSLEVIVIVSVEVIVVAIIKTMTMTMTAKYWTLLCSHQYLSDSCMLPKDEHYHTPSLTKWQLRSPPRPHRFHKFMAYRRSLGWLRSPRRYRKFHGLYCL